MEDDYICGKDERVTGGKLVVYGEYCRTDEMPEESIEFLSEFGDDKESIDGCLADHIVGCRDCFENFVTGEAVHLILSAISKARFNKLMGNSD